MQSKEICEFCRIDAQGEELLKNAITKLGLSARAYDRILKVGRTIADMAGSADIRPEHISEAIQYRSLDRNLIAYHGLSVALSSSGFERESGVGSFRTFFLTLQVYLIIYYAFTVTNTRVRSLSFSSLATIVPRSRPVRTHAAGPPHSCR